MNDEAIKILREVLAVAQSSTPRNETVRRFVAEKLDDLEGRDAAEAALRAELEAEKAKVADLERQLAEEKAKNP